MSRHKIELENIEKNGWDLLDSLVIWASEELCAEKLGISVDTLVRRIKEKHGVTFAEYKDQKREPMLINLFKKQYDVAMTGNVSMLIWLGKQYLNQSDKQDRRIESKVEVIPAFEIIEYDGSDEDQAI